MLIGFAMHATMRDARFYVIVEELEHLLTPPLGNTNVSPKLAPYK